MENPTPSSKNFSTHDSIKDLVDRYDGFILDQYGVMHNGTNALEGAVDAVKLLQKRQKKLMILSNSSSLAKDTMKRLPRLGFDADYFAGGVTSGEVASRYVREHFAGNPDKNKALVFTWKTPFAPSPQIFLEACGDIQIVTPFESDEKEKEHQQADFILLHAGEVMRGPGADGVATETDLGDFLQTGDLKTVIEPILKDCLTRDLPMICCNPDFISIKADGKAVYMPGTIAKFYQEMGGKVISFGKPHREHFEACIKEMDLPKDRVVHVGDSIHHDVAGANATGISCIFVAGGVHLEELGCALGDLPGDDKLQSLFSEHNEAPTHVVPMFR